MQRDGYTLIEAIVVLAILAIGLSIVTPMMFKGISGTRLKATAREIGSALRFTRNVAITKRATVFFAIDLDQELYGMQLLARDRPSIPGASAGDRTAEEDAEQADDGGAASRSYSSDNVMSNLKTYEINPPVELISFFNIEGDELTSGSCGIIFFPKGNCSGGSIEIGKPEGQHMMITVDPITANVDIALCER